MDVGSRNDAAFATFATPIASHPALTPVAAATVSASGIPTTTATSRLMSPEMSAVIRITQATATRGRASGRRAARRSNHPARTMSQPATTTAATVANGSIVTFAASKNDRSRSRSAAEAARAARRITQEVTS